MQWSLCGTRLVLCRSRAEPSRVPTVNAIQARLVGYAERDTFQVGIAMCKEDRSAVKPAHKLTNFEFSEDHRALGRMLSYIAEEAERVGAPLTAIVCATALEILMVECSISRTDLFDATFIKIV